MKISHKTHGFTLVELIIVIAIIAVLASLAFMALSGETAQARDSKRMSDIKTFEDSVSTSNGKNKKIGYAVDNVGKKEDGINSRTNTITDKLETNSGVLKSIRGAALVPVDVTLFDSDVLPTAARDPKGSYYIGAFLSSTDYSFFATKENPDTKIATALVRGSFKDGSILDVLAANLSGSSTDVSVANPTRFVRGDVIKVDDELMVVIGYDIIAPNSLIKVVRGYVASGTSIDGVDDGVETATIVVHNKGASVKLVTPAKGGNSLVCWSTKADEVNITTLSSAANTAVMGGIPNSKFTTLAAATEHTTGTVIDQSAGNVCKSGTGYSVTDDSTYLPYKIN